MPAYQHAILPWNEALSTLTNWIPGFANIRKPEQLSFDSVAQIMISVSGGFQSLPPALLECETTLIDAALTCCGQKPTEVIVIPDCGVVSRPPFRLPLSELVGFMADFDYMLGEHQQGLLDGVSDIFFGFDTGDMLFIDHDERIWFTPSRA